MKSRSLISVMLPHWCSKAETEACGKLYLVLTAYFCSQLVKYWPLVSIVTQYECLINIYFINGGLWNGLYYQHFLNRGNSGKTIWVRRIMTAFFLQVRKRIFALHRRFIHNDSFKSHWSTFQVYMMTFFSPDCSSRFYENENDIFW